MKIHLICPVRNVTDEQQEEIDTYVEALRLEGNTVHNPKYAVDQDDATGYNICLGHLTSMSSANRVDIFWDVNSKGSHFDLGMAFAMNKAVKLVKTYTPDTEGKSYVKVILEMQKVTDKYDHFLKTSVNLIEKIKEHKFNEVKAQNYEKATEWRAKEKDLLDMMTKAKLHFNIIE